MIQAIELAAALFVLFPANQPWFIQPLPLLEWSFLIVLSSICTIIIPHYKPVDSQVREINELHSNTGAAISLKSLNLPQFLPVILVSEVPSTKQTAESIR